MLCRENRSRDPRTRNRDTVRKYILGLSPILCSHGIPGLMVEASPCLLIQQGYAELRIHEGIERGSNDSIKNGSSMAAAVVTGCCGGV